MSNHLKEQTSPYLLQHAENPVDWYPWCKEAFDKAKAEDKPIFLSIGYSTCHWCHVMAHESFENEEVADILNRDFVSIKVDKEERPDIDSIYMAVCQAFTGSGGWPTSIFMSPEKEPFFAGTYFPAAARYGAIGFKDLLAAIHEKWGNDRKSLLKSAQQVIDVLSHTDSKQGNADFELIESAIHIYEQSFDEKYGGFGKAPKFPTPHNLIFLLTEYEKSGNKTCLNMSEKTLLQMYRGGLFDHIGYGFSRYSTDKYFLVPHFEKMLYDNALLILAYCKASNITKNSLYQEIAEKTADYILREMTSPEGGFYSAQDADSDGEEGKYYVFTPDEIIAVLGEETGKAFNKHYGITAEGNFEGKSIPNLLKSKMPSEAFKPALQRLYEYRKNRYNLHLDDKILTSWNSLMIAALCNLYRVSHNSAYLEAAKKAQRFIEEKLYNNEDLFVSFRDGKQSTRGFLDDYAFYIFALLALYDVTLDKNFLEKAEKFFCKAADDFCDESNSGFYLYGEHHEAMIFRPKETYDGAIPSGNSVMAYNLTRLFYLTSYEKLEKLMNRQLDFLSAEAEHYPAGYSMFLVALSDFFKPPQKIVVVGADSDTLQNLPLNVPLSSIVIVLEKPTTEYPLKENKTTYYVCKNNSCLPPTNNL